MKFIFALFFLSNLTIAESNSTKRLCHVELKDAGICAELVTLTELTRKTAASLELSFFDKKSFKPVNLDGEMKAKLWMVMKNGHEHGSEPLKTQKLKDKYRLTNAWFLMMGEWKLKLEVNHNSKEYKTEIPLCIEKDASDSHVGSCK